MSSVPFLMPFALDRFSEGTGKSREELLERHTLFPYATFFMTPERRAGFKRRAMSPDGISRVDRLAQAVLRGNQGRRVCFDCMDDDERRRGETYWHRSHLLPGVEVCSIHGTRLRPTSLPLQGAAHAGDALLPADVTTYESPTGLDADVLTTIAYFSIVALTNIHAQHPWLERYLAVCAALGYGLRRGAIASRVVALDLMQFFGHGFLKSLSADVDVDSRIPWPALLVRPGYETRVASTKHILMQTFLLHARPVSNLSHAPYRRPGPSRRNYQIVDREAVRRMRTYLTVQRRRRQKVTVGALIKASGEQPCMKRFGQRFPLSRAFVAKFRKSPMALRRLRSKE